MGQRTGGADFSLALVSLLVIVVTNVQYEAYTIMGKPQRYSAIREAFSWNGRNRADAWLRTHRKEAEARPRNQQDELGDGEIYVRPRSIFALSGLIAALIGLSARAVYSAGRSRPVYRPRGWVVAGAEASAGVAVAVTILAWLPLMPVTAFHGSFLLLSFDALFAGATIDGEPDYSQLSRQQLAEHYRRVARSYPGNDARYFGKAKGYDVVFFIMETVPTACVDFTLEEPDLKAIGMLRKEAWIAARHYSTYPNSLRALWSLFTSTYPPYGGTYGLSLRERPAVAPIGRLREASYRTALYSPANGMSLAAASTIRNLGFSEVIRSPGEAVAGNLPHRATGAAAQPRLQWRRSSDTAALEAMERDAVSNIRRSQRFVSAYAPQITHAPWVLSQEDPDPWQYCRSLAGELDASLGEIVRVLDAEHRLDKTLIVVTGDHGIRGDHEDPEFREHHAIDNRMFEVPFLLYAPGILDRPVSLTWVTSHIDVMPSILNLLGIGEDKTEEQGMPLWDTQIAGRVTFLWSNLQTGSDGYQVEGAFRSWNHFTNAVFGGNDFRFAAATPLATGSTAAVEARRAITEMDALRIAWARDYIE